jgi:signal transduction histidine kinase/ligand-binding sensor domain-containing protein/CheY-like chemotaxis protein
VRGGAATGVRAALWAAALAWPLAAQQYSFRYYGHEQGLNNLAIQCLLQDRAGFLWVGAQNGLYRYAGRRFEEFGVAQGLPSARIESLHESPDGTLWAGTRRGLARWNGRMFEHVPLPGAAEILGRSGLASDARGNLFVGTGAGLFIVEASGPRLLPKPEGVGSRAVYGLHVDPDGVVWYGCGTRLCRLDGGVVTVFAEGDQLPRERWDAILTDHDGRLWIRGSRHLMIRDPATGAFFSHPADIPQSADFGHLALERDGVVLAPTDAGLFRLSATAVVQRVGETEGLPGSVFSVLQDREGSLWMGMQGLGLYRWIGQKEWESWTTAQGLSSDGMWGIRRDPSGALWVGTDDGVNRLDPATKRWRAWTARDGLGGARVRAVAIQPDGVVWTGSSPGGVSRLDPRTGRIARFGPSSGLSADRITSLEIDREGTLWVAARDGLYRSTRLEEAAFERQLPPGTDDNELFFHCTLDAQGRVWVSGSRGLAVYDRGRWRRFKRSDGLLSDYVGASAHPPDGSVWIGYREAAGISRMWLEVGRPRFEHFSRRDGLGSDQALFLGVDSRGRVWFGSDAGAAVQDRGRFRQFTQDDGLIWGDCDSHSFWADADGSVWIGTSRGLSHYRPSGASPGAGPPPVIVRFLLGGRAPSPGETPSAPFGDRTVEIEFSAMSFLHERDLRFRYRLAGLEDAWVETDQRHARYSSLPPGDYRFEVAARPPGGDWSAEPASASFKVLPPWWGMWEVRLLGLAGLVGLTWIGWRARIQAMMAEQRRLERAVRERTQELAREKELAEEANRLKSRFLANMSHEIRTPLNGVLGMTELLREGPLTVQQSQYLDHARTSAETLLALLNDILDLSKIEAGRMDLECVPFAPREVVEEAVAMLAPRAGEKGLSLTSSIDPAVPARLAGDPVRLRQVILNLIANAVKFTERGSIGVEVAAEPAGAGERGLRFTVWDTGIGIPRDKLDVVFESFRQADGSTTRRYGGSGLGLAICRELARLMGGRIWVESEAGAGSRFHFTARFQTTEGETAHAAVRAAATAASGAPARILVAEDNRVNQLLTVRMLERMGHAVTTAHTGAEALAAIEREPFDLVLMDVQMPEMDGLEATRAIRRSGDRVPVIALTAHAMKGDRERCLDAGMSGYLTKPVQLAELAAEIESWRGREHPLQPFLTR